MYKFFSAWQQLAVKDHILLTRAAEGNIWQNMARNK